MPKKIVFGALAAALSGSLFVWMITSGWLSSKLRAQEQSAGKTHLSGAQALPVPDPPFKGVIDRKAKDSKPDFPQAVTALKDAPNVLLILTDDTGFGASSTLAGPIPTPAFDRVAQNGLRFNNFHTTDCARLRGRRC
jgi:arylsulfatase